MNLVNQLLVGLLVGVSACHSDPAHRVSPNAPFCAPHDAGHLADEELDEVSGLVASRKNPGALWVHNDSGHPAEVHLISTQGQRLATYHLPGAKSVDWEDVAIGPGPEAAETYLYVGDIGDNVSLYDEHAVYRFVEPTYTASSLPRVDTITDYDRLPFTYANGASDAETLLLDPLTGELYVLTKEMDRIQVYTVPNGTPPSSPLSLSPVAALPFDEHGWLDRLVGGDISADGTEVLLKTYEYVLYWKRPDTTVALPALWRLPADTLPYRPEPQGEAIGFAADGSGYYTLSEQNFGSDVHLYFYPRCSHDSTDAMHRVSSQP